jgi:uncharacterized protein YcbX
VPSRVTDLYRYPIKSCRGEPLTELAVEPWGLAGDRRWMVVDANGRFVTAREYPRLLLAKPSVTADSITLSGPDRPTLTVAIPTPDPRLSVTVWDSTVAATPADARAGDWFSDIVGQPVQLVYLDDPTRRATNPEHSHDGDRVSFADGYPLLLTTHGSLEQLNSLVAQGPHPAEGPLPMMRFRPNVVIDQTPAWDEDQWTVLRIGSVVFRVASGCGRCVMTTVDPDTSAKGKEPLVTLAKHRRWDGGLWFGVNLIPDAPGADAHLEVGDKIEILERSPAQVTRM